MKNKSRYPGAKPFEIKEKNIFFGRTLDIHKLHQLVGIEKTVLLYSKSGLGKTSLINAGLIPKLKEDKNYLFKPIKIRFGVCSDDNYVSPKKRIINLLKKESTNKFKVDFPELYEDSIAYWIKSIQYDDPNQVCVLIFDQFEELFTYSKKINAIEELKKALHDVLYFKTTDKFRKKLLDLLEREPNALAEKDLDMLTSFVNVRMVFAVRSDCLSLLNQLADNLPNLQKVFYELKPLNPEEAYKAIREPALIKGDFTCPRFIYNGNAIDAILNELKDENNQIETFQLQLVCQYAEKLVYDKYKKHDKAERDKVQWQINLSELGNIKNIYLTFYNDFIKDLSIEDKEERRRLHSLLEERFIYEPEKRRLPVLAKLIQNDLSADTLRALEDTHLIRKELFHGNYYYELSHDTLVEPILKSYHERMDREAAELIEINRQKEEYERLKKEEEEKEKGRMEFEAIRAKSRRQRQLNLIVTIAALFCFGFMLFGFKMWSNANKALKVVKEVNIKIENEKKIAYEAILNFKQADSLRKESDINSFLIDARIFYMYGHEQDALRSIEKALAIDSTNTQALDLLNVIRNH